MMRNPSRINEILNQLAEIWQQNPDLRLGQLILNVIPDLQAYYIEDDKLIELLKECYK